MKINFQKKKYLMRGNLIKKKILNKNINFLILKKNKIINYFLLDGPPFANGDIHLGHVLNKIIKNIIINNYFLNNYLLLNNIGWDTHGLPIEQKFLIKNNYFYNYRFFVCNTIKNQKNDFSKLFLFNNKYDYNTMEPRYESFQLKIFQYLLINNLIKLENFPNFWCFNCNSSLSYSEIIYKKKKSFSFFFKIKLLNFYLVIWTTSLWTLINNQACFFIKKNIYTVLKSKKCYLIILNFILKKIIKIIKIKCKIVSFLKGVFFYKKKYILFLNIIMKYFNKKNFLIKNDYIDKNIGSGFIHCSPSNGIDDYEFYYKNYKIYNLLTTKCFTKKLLLFNNLNIFFLNYIFFKIILKRKILIKKKIIIHKYMFCWRHKSLIIYYLNKQIFINLNKKFEKISLKSILLNNLNKIKFFPKKIKKQISNMIFLRNNWCISRQRFWGVYVYYKKTYNEKKYSFYKNITRTYSSHIFFFLKKKNINVLDVWFDSSISSLLFNNLNIIIEGKDQIRGWFQSCIIMQCLLYLNLNIKYLVMHNFCVNKNGEKFSKSDKNFIKIKKILDLYSIEIIKYYFSKHNFFKNICFNNLKIENLSNSYKKIRIFFKFIINNFYNFNFKNKQILLIDIWIIKKINIFFKLISDNFKKFNYYKSIKILIFIINFLIYNYFNYSKNKLYLSKLNSLLRNSCLFSIYNIFLLIKKSIFPVLSFTFNELSTFIKNKKLKFFIKDINFSYFIKIKKNFFNYTILYSNKLKFLNKIKEEFFNFKNNINIYNSFWKWFIKKNFFNFYYKKEYCEFSKINVKYKNFVYKKKNCIYCTINKFHNYEELRFYV